LVSIGSRVPKARRGRRPLITTPCITPGHPQVHIRTKVLLSHILEMPLLGHVGINLHLGQKPKLGGRYTDISLIYTLYFVGTLYIHILLSFCCSCFVSTFQNTKRPKVFMLFLFVCFFSFLVLVCFTF
jgi:hypothetical protein